MADPCPSGAPLPRVRSFDERPLVFDGQSWPVEGPPFEEPELRSAWHRLQYVAMRAAQGGVGALPAALRRVLVHGIAGAARRLDRRHTRAARDFVATALPDLAPEARERLVVQAWRHLLRVALTTEGVERHVLGRRLGDVYDVHMAPEVEEVCRAPGGFLCVTAHAGYWEVSPPAVAAIFERPCYAVGKAPRNDFVAAHVRRMRERQGMRLVPRNGAMQVVPAALRQGCATGLLLDHRPRQKPVYAPYFGRLAACDRSAGVLLRRVAAPILFYGCYGADAGGPAEGGRWRFDLRFTRLVRPEELEGRGPEEIATLVNRELERIVLHRPEEVFWLHDRYKGAPAPASAATTGPQQGAASTQELG